MSTPSYLLSELLATLGSSRMALELKKRQLIENSAYTASGVFCLFDLDNSGRISLTTLYDFLKQRYIFPTESQLFVLFKEMDTLKMGYIEITQLTDFLTPQSRPTSLSKSCFGSLDSAVTAILSQYLQNYRTLEIIKLKLREHATTQAYFQLLDTNRNGKVSTLEVRSFMLGHGCMDQDVISCAVIEIQNRLGCNFDERVFSAFLSVAEQQHGRPQSRSLTKPSELIHHPYKTQTQHTSPGETRPAMSKTMNEFDHLLEVRSQENEERRHYLKEQEKLRTKIMEEVLARKRSYLNVRMPEEKGQRLTSEEDYIQQLEKKQREYNKTTTIPTSPVYEQRLIRTAVSPNIVRQTLNREEAMKRAGSEAQLKIEQIQLNARRKAEERRKMEMPRDTSGSSGFQELLQKKNSELEMEKQRRMTLEKELSRSKEEIALLKTHLQAVEKLNYREMDVLRPTKPNCQGLNEPGFRDGELSKSKYSGFGLRENNREAGSIYQANRASLGRSGERRQLDSKYELEQALRRSRVERQFAKFKLQKEMARSRVGWR